MRACVFLHVEPLSALSSSRLLSFQLLTKKKLHDLVREIDPNEQLDEDVEEVRQGFLITVSSQICTNVNMRMRKTLAITVDFYIIPLCILFSIPWSCPNPFHIHHLESLFSFEAWAYEKWCEQLNKWWDVSGSLCNIAFLCKMVFIMFASHFSGAATNCRRLYRKRSDSSLSAGTPSQVQHLGSKGCSATSR